ALPSPVIYDVVDDGRIRVPVVVPDAIDLSGVHRPQKGWITTVEGENPELVVAGAKVEQGVSVRVEGHRALDDVPGEEPGPQVLPRRRIDEMNRRVVGAKDELGQPVRSLPDRGLAGPSHPAPDPRLSTL